MAEKILRNTSNSSLPLHDIFALPLITLQFTIIFNILTSCISLLANTYILYVIYINKNLRKPSYYALANLAIANIMVAVLYPIPLLVTFLSGIPGKLNSKTLIQIICGFIRPLAVTAVMVVNCTLAFIAIDKYRTLVYKSNSTRRTSINLRTTILIIIGIWVIGLLEQWPRTILVLRNRSAARFCRFFPNPQFQMSIKLTISTANIIIPFIIMLVCHYKIANSLKYHRHRLIFVFEAASRMNRIQPHQFKSYSSKSVRLAARMLRKLTYWQFFFCFLWLLANYLSNFGYAYKINFYLVGIAFNIQQVTVVATGLPSPIAYILWLKKFRKPIQSFCSAIQGH
ncbi:rhodopsin [Trichoplax sp. H2]|nr:rhodopsin [Trichoplax sp. H2]|eukprot:RDD39990.1 rhodopsin [Trichoplax sp. H2]